jgi:hypothetical protein
MTSTQDMEQIEQEDRIKQLNPLGTLLSIIFKYITIDTQVCHELQQNINDYGNAGRIYSTHFPYMEFFKHQIPRLYTVCGYDQEYLFNNDLVYQYDISYRTPSMTIKNGPFAGWNISCTTKVICSGPYIGILSNIYDNRERISILDVNLSPTSPCTLL